ncbi:FkbM family methyltransferase [Halomonas organivorans]
MSNVSSVSIRGNEFKLVTRNRSLQLCARMNYETEVLDFIDGMASGSIFYDLGACEGRFSLYAAARGIDVVAFEPERYNLDVLNENIALNERLPGRIHVMAVAVGDHNEKRQMNVGQPWEGGHQKVVVQENLRRDLRFEASQVQDVEVRRLDDLLHDGKLPLPTYLKVDIDGSELSFLRGACRTLSRTSVKGVVFEVNKEDDGFSEILASLASLGWRVKAEYQVPNEPELFNIMLERAW